MTVPSSAATQFGPNLKVGINHPSNVSTQDPVILCKKLRIATGTSASNSTALGYIYGQFQVLDVRLTNTSAAAQVIRVGTQTSVTRFVSAAVCAVGTYVATPNATAGGNDWHLSGAANTITTVMASKASASAKDGAIDVAISYVIVG